MRTPSYEHSQSLWPLWVVMVTTSCGLLLLATTGAAHDREAQVILFVTATALPTVILALLGRLVIALDETTLEWRFGFLGLPRWRVALADIAAVDVVRTTWLDGWGIRRKREGWLYNAVGFDAVRLSMRDGRRIFLGSDEARRLAAFIEQRRPRRA